MNVLFDLYFLYTAPITHKMERFHSQNICEFFKVVLCILEAFKGIC
jgi:hypothetical protein